MKYRQSLQEIVNIRKGIRSEISKLIENNQMKESMAQIEEQN